MQERRCDARCGRAVGAYPSPVPNSPWQGARVTRAAGGWAAAAHPNAAPNMDSPRQSARVTRGARGQVVDAYPNPVPPMIRS